MRLDCSIFDLILFILELHVPVDLAARCSAVLLGIVGFVHRS